MMKMKITALHKIIAIFVSIVLTSCSSYLQNKKDLSMLVMPIGSINKTESIYLPFQKYLKKQTGRNVNLITSKSYVEIRSLLKSNKTFDIVNLNGVLYSQDFNPKRYAVFAQETSGGEATYNSAFIVNIDSPFWNLEALKGKKIGFGSKYSTSGSLIPVLMLEKAGLSPTSDYSYVHYPSHIDTANAVINKQIDAGAISWKTIKSVIEKGSIKASKTRIIAVSNPIPLDPWLINRSLSKELKYKIKSSFYDLNDKDIQQSLGTDGFIPIHGNPLDSLKDESNIYLKILGND